MSMIKHPTVEVLLVYDLLELGEISVSNQSIHACQIENVQSSVQGYEYIENK